MKILLTIDPSVASQIVLEQTAARPWPEGSSFEILSILEPLHVSPTLEGARRAVHQVEKIIKSAIEHLSSKGWEATGGAFVDYDPKSIILDRAKRMHADLIIAGPHARSKVQRFLLGSIAGAVLRYAPCSVEIVRPWSSEKKAVESMKVLFATDGSECSRLAASSIAERPWPTGTQIRILSAVEVILSPKRALLELPFLASVIESARVEGIERSREALVAAKEILSSSPLNVTQHETEVDPRRAILDEAKDWCADLIILGTHGRHGFDRFQLGSVSETVAIHADCSVEVIRRSKPPVRL
jgi:nucleotide-binding universal stress UspA family protein